MAMAVSSLVGTVLMFLWFGVLACSAQGSRKRSRFYGRLTCAGVVMSALALGLALAINVDAVPQRALGLLWVALLLAAAAVAPVFCYHTFTPFKGSSEGDGGDGPGSGPPPPPSSPPRGGDPLPDADQARTRRRDHNRPAPHGISRRRPEVDVPPAPVKR
jgi:hypothetical protein